MKNSQPKSLGYLKPNPTKTKTKSPAMLGKIKLKRHTIESLLEEFADGTDDECEANIAAWKNIDKTGSTYLTVELQPRWKPQRQHQAKSRKTGGVLDFLPDENDE